MAQFQTQYMDPEGQAQGQSYRMALGALAVLYFMMGFITCLNDTLVPFFKAGFSLTYTQSSLVQFYFFLTYGLMSIPAGRIVERIGYKKGMVLGFSLAACGALLFLPASVFHRYFLFLAALFVLAVGIVVLQVAANPYITLLGPARTASARLTLIQGIGSVGTTVAPLFGGYVILSKLDEAGASSQALIYPYLGIMALLLLIAFVVSRLNLPVMGGKPERKQSAKQGAGKAEGDSVEHAAGRDFADNAGGRRETASGEADDARGVFAFRNLRLGTWAIFAYVGAEVAIGTFLTNYISDLLQIEEKAANPLVAFYWGGMLVGRLLGALLLKFIRPASVLSGCAAAAVGLILLSVSTGGNIAVWAMIAVGLCNSVMFAIIFSLSVQGLGAQTARASGILSTAIAGGALISLAQGFLTDHFSWAASFMLPAACYLYILFYALNGHKSKPASASGGISRDAA